MTKEVEVHCAGSVDIITDENQADIEIYMKNDFNVESESTFEVEAQINEWTLVSDQIYIVRKDEPIPDWLEAAIQEIINGDGFIIDDVSDLIDEYIDYGRIAFNKKYKP